MWKVTNCRQYYVNVEAQDRLHAALQHCSSQPVLCVRCILIFLENKCKRQLHHSSETESLLRLLQPSFIIETYLWLSWSCTNRFLGEISPSEEPDYSTYARAYNAMIREVEQIHQSPCMSLVSTSSCWADHGLDWCKWKQSKDCSMQHCSVQVLRAPPT